jgi:WD40 repeat protein
MVNISESLLATGDDAGAVKLWDIRVGNNAVKQWDWHDDYVSGFCYNSDHSTLLSIGGDAVLCAYDLRVGSKSYNDRESQQNKASRSDDQEAELSCVCLCKSGRKVLCGTQDGVILVFSWGRWGDCSDRFPGHPETVDCMLRVDESTVLTGSSDGLIRVLSVHPNKAREGGHTLFLCLLDSIDSISISIVQVLGVLGDHEDFPVEAMVRTADGRLLASIAHDEKVRFWDTAPFADDEPDEGAEGGEGEGEGEDDKVDGRLQGKRRMDEEPVEGEEEWEDEDSSDTGDDEMNQSDGGGFSDDDEDEGDEDDAKGKGSRGRLPTRNEQFYADM